MLDSNGFMKRGDSRLPSDLNSALRPDEILLENGLIDQEAITRVIAEYLEITVARSSEFPYEAIEAGGASYSFLRQNRILPLDENDDELTIAMANPFDETGGQITEFERLGSRPFNIREMKKLCLDTHGKHYYVRDEVDQKIAQQVK